MKITDNKVLFLNRYCIRYLSRVVRTKYYLGYLLKSYHTTCMYLIQRTTFIIGCTTDILYILVDIDLAYALGKLFVLWINMSIRSGLRSWDNYSNGFIECQTENRFWLTDNLSWLRRISPTKYLLYTTFINDSQIRASQPAKNVQFRKFYFNVCSSHFLNFTKLSSPKRI